MGVVEAGPGAGWQVRRALDQITRDGLSIAAGWLAALLAVFALADPWTNPPPHQMRIALVDWLTAAALLGAFVAFRYWNVDARWANAVGGSVAIVTAVGILHDAWTLGDPEQTTYLMLVLAGAASILLSGRWMAAVIAVSFIGWAIVAAATPEAKWLTFGMALFAACVLSAVIHIVRVQTYGRMERLRQDESQRTEELEIREEALQGLVGALQESEDRYRRLVDQAPDAFLVLSDRKVLYVNAAGVRLFGAKSADELIGRDPVTLVHEDYRDQIVARNLQIEKTGVPTQFTEIKVLRLDGETVEVETLGQPITFMGRPADQTVVRDITDRKRADAERLRALQHLGEVERLKDMDRVKTQFVNTISHELRTPLTPVRVQLHILKRGIPPRETYDKALNVLDRNFSRLNSLVDELLEVARIQAGTLRITRTYVDVHHVVNDVLTSYVDVAKQGGIELTAKAEPDLLIMGDARRLTQVMYNLLGNAFKFTPKGGHVHVGARRDGDSVLVSVTDNGAGLTPQDITRLFEPFSQVHDTMEKTHAGTGLGLYICRGIIESHQGRIWCESHGKGRGSTFSFRIPRHLDGADDAESASVPVMDDAARASAPTAAPQDVRAR